MTSWPTAVQFSLPGWVAGIVDPGAIFPTDRDRVALAVRLADENVRRQTGGPFGAAVFEAATGRLVAVGVNLVTTLKNCALHAEMVAFMLAQQRVGSHTLHWPGGPDYELATSCAPCAMCLGGVLWSGVRRVVSAATREDAVAMGFDEGPVFPASLAYLEERGIRFAPGILQAEARAVMARYIEQGGAVYNG